MHDLHSRIWRTITTNRREAGWNSNGSIVNAICILVYLFHFIPIFLFPLLLHASLPNTFSYILAHYHFNSHKRKLYAFHSIQILITFELKLQQETLQMPLNNRCVTAAEIIVVYVWINANFSNILLVDLAWIRCAFASVCHSLAHGQTTDAMNYSLMMMKPLSPWKQIVILCLLRARL